MTDFLTGYVVPAGVGLAGVPGLKASQRSTDGALTVFETSVGAGPPLHVHDREDECFYVLDGELSIRCGGDAFGAAAGSFVFLPRGRPHRFWAVAEPARLLLIVRAVSRTTSTRSTPRPPTTSAAGSVNATASTWFRGEPASLRVPAWLVSAHDDPFGPVTHRGLGSPKPTADYAL